MEEVTGEQAFTEIKFLSNQLDRNIEQVSCNREEKNEVCIIFHMFFCEFALSSLSLPTWPQPQAILLSGLIGFNQGQIKEQGLQSLLTFCAYCRPCTNQSQNGGE